MKLRYNVYVEELGYIMTVDDPVFDSDKGNFDPRFTVEDLCHASVRNGEWLPWGWDPDDETITHDLPVGKEVLDEAVSSCYNGHDGKRYTCLVVPTIVSQGEAQ